MSIRSLISSLLLPALAGVVLLLSGCAQQRELGWCTVGGAGIGALVGAGAGFGIGEAAEGNSGFNSRVTAGAVTGAVVGGIIGGVAGHYICDPIVQPPLPPPPPPPPPMPPPPPPPPPVKEKLVLRGVHFDFNKSNIRPGDAAVLDEAASTLKANPDVDIDVNGYCDAIGGEEYNLRLSDRRANAVVDYLVKDGISEIRLHPHGYGKTDFVATNDTAEGRAQNRRVELVPEQ
jgi:outer membrane protein OmpA-like peptidoglycan-associated protein